MNEDLVAEHHRPGLTPEQILGIVILLAYVVYQIVQIVRSLMT